MKPIRVVVCGTTFGRVYLNGIKLLPKMFALVGMLSNGSRQSRRVAKEFDIPLCTDIADLPPFDLACIVVRSGIVGGAGSELALQFLTSGKHVVMEHPIHANDVISCYRAASKNGAKFWVNTFYPWNPTISRYIELADTLHKQFGIMYLDVACSIHFLYSTLDILGRITGGFSPWHLEESTHENGVFTTISGVLRNIPVCLRVVNHTNPEQPDDFNHVGHRITAFTPSGNLVLTETDGTILWHPNTTIPRDEMGLLDINADESLSRLPLHQSLVVNSCVSRDKLYRQVWPQSIATYLTRVYNALDSSRTQAQEAEYLLALCAVWTRIGQLIGPAVPFGADLPSTATTLEQLIKLSSDS